jgi:hypothetical protein
MDAPPLSHTLTYLQAVGMNPEEYRYLTRSAIPNFGKPSVLE